MCDWMHQEGACVARAERANHAMNLCCQAGATVRELERQLGTQTDQLDLFEPSIDQAAIAFWWAVHKACGDEYRRLSKLFWQRCSHPYVYRPLEDVHVA